MQNSRILVDQVNATLSKSEDAKWARTSGNMERLRKMVLKKYLTLTEANSTTKRTFGAIETDSESSKAARLIPVVRSLVSTKLVA